MVRKSMLLATVALLAAGPSLAEEAPITSVTLYEAGLAAFHRSAGDVGEITLEVPLRDVNDVLKTLSITGTGIDAAQMQLDGTSTLEDVFSSLPITSSEITDLGRLLQALPGTRVRLTDTSSPFEGRVLGVASSETCAEEAGCHPLLTLIEDGGSLRRVELLPQMSIEVLDEDVVAAIERGVTAMAASAASNVRQVTISLSGTPQKAGVDYVVTAPIWKTAYRSLLQEDGGFSLQAWAVVENASGEDWEDVSLSLSSGHPRTMQAELFDREWAQRALYRVEPPVMFKSTASAVDELAADSMGFAAEMAPQEPAAQFKAGADLRESFSSARFTFSNKVDIPAGRILSLPFVTDSLKGRQHLAWVGGRSGRTASPVIRIEVTNDLPVRLPAGIMTVREETTGYVGDAAFPMLAPGEEGSITFSTDETTEITESREGNDRDVALQVTDAGVLLRDLRLQKVTYRVEAPKGLDVPLVIEHPDQRGWRTQVDGEGLDVRPEEGDYGQDWLMIELEPSDAASRTIVVRSETDIETIHQIENVASAQVLRWLSRSSLSEDAREVLTEILEIKRGMAVIEEEVRKLTAERDQVSRDQLRARDMLQALERGSSEYARFLASLIEAEDRISEIDDQSADLRRQHDQFLNDLGKLRS
ncbi:DUF4139 domain-containing protein [Epibacterium sp. DP7N7-1]|nr:DUF4139 domain-containing protein [Epibacterium sp. DP7N7-1]